MKKKWPAYPSDPLNPKALTHVDQEKATNRDGSTLSVSCTSNKDCKEGLEICSALANCGARRRMSILLYRAEATKA